MLAIKNRIFSFAFKRPYLTDAIVLALSLWMFNLFIAVIYDTLQYINAYKVIWSLIIGTLVFIPMYLVTWFTLRKLNSKKIFLLVSGMLWLLFPFLISLGRSDTFNAWQGSLQVFDDGKLTLNGYFLGLQNPFLVLILYAVVLAIAVHKK